MVGSCSARGPRALAVLSVATCLWLASIVVAQPSPGKKPDPAVLIGPTRITLVGGKTIEGIAVFREPTRVRVILEDGTEITFDPAKVESVVALADLPDEPPAPVAKPKSSIPAAKGATKKPLKLHAEPGETTITARGRKTAASPAAGSGAKRSGPGAGIEEEGRVEGAEAAAAREKEERRREVEELAGMLQSAIANAAIEGARTGGPDGADDGPAADETGKDVGGGAEAAQPADENDEKKSYKPKPEDFDATQPVNKAGYRFLGPKAKGLPETPPQGDFPRPASSTTSLGFKADVWRPSTGFSSAVQWPKPLDAPTSFPNRLSGLDRPITSFGPRWWSPTSTTWSSSIFPQTWQPADAFAQDQERKSPPKPPENPPANQNK